MITIILPIWVSWIFIITASVIVCSLAVIIMIIAAVSIISLFIEGLNSRKWR